MRNHESLAHPIEAPSSREQWQLLSDGYKLDEFGRPLHPWSDRTQHLPEGKGTFYHWGPNRTVDSVIITHDDNPAILLIRRTDNGLLALPGGFIDENEHPLEAVRRELAEETHMIAPAAEPVLVYRGPVEDHRSTKHAWPETSAYYWQIFDRVVVQGSDDALSAEWVPLDSLDFAALHGSHAELIEAALRHLLRTEGR